MGSALRGRKPSSVNNTPIISQPDVFQHLVDDHQRYGRTGEDRSAGNGGIRADDEPSHKYDEQHARGAAAEAGDDRFPLAYQFLRVHSGADTDDQQTGADLAQGRDAGGGHDIRGQAAQGLTVLVQRQRAGHAAELLCLSQPAVTRSIHRLEESLGCKLFTRVSRGVRLTVEGMALFSHVDSAFKSLSNGERELKRLAAFEAGTLIIGATETPLYHFLLPKLGQFREMHPNVTLQVQGSSTYETIQMLRAEQADVVLAVSPLTDVEDLSVTELASFRDVFVAGPRFKSLAGRHLSYDEIFRFPIVAVESGTSARGNLDTWFAEQGITFLPNYSVRTSSTVIPFVEQGLAIGILPSLFAQVLLAQEGFFALDTEPIPARQILLVHRGEGRTSLLCQEFIRLLQS